MEIRRKCSYCKELLYGRSDKRFCNDHCRSAFNNQVRHPMNVLIRKVNRQLLQNRQLLAACYKKKLIRVKRDWLVQHGFSFSHVTHILQDAQGAFYHCCYDHAYIPAGTEIMVTQIGHGR